MGFRTGSFATIWEVTPVSNTMTKARISISRKNKMTDQYEQDFGGFIVFCGTALAQKALSLKPKDRIKLGDVDVSNRYDKEKNTTYTDFKVFSYEMADGTGSGGGSSRAPSAAVDEGEADESDLPW